MITRSLCAFAPLCLISFSFIVFSVPSLSSLEEEHFARRIQAHLLLNDPFSARKEAKEALSLYPQSMSLQEGYIRSLARLGEERAMLVAWKRYTHYFPHQALNRHLIEQMGWGVLDKASHSSSLVMRQMALLAAFFSQDAKGVHLLSQAMHDQNYAIRALAVKLASHCCDHKLLEEVRRLFREERVWGVRQEVLEAIGSMKILDLQGELEKVISSEDTSAKEKALAISSLLNLLDTLNRPEAERLICSPHMGLRQLACQAIAHFQLLRDLDLLFRLTTDSQASVRTRAFQALGVLRPGEREQEILVAARRGAKDPHYQVALSSIWLLTLYRREEGQPLFIRFLTDQRREVRLLAAAVLSATGAYGLPCMLQQFRCHSDLYVRLNLALGLMGQRVATQEATAFLKQMLMEEKIKWDRQEVGMFHPLVNYPTRDREDSLVTPEEENLLIRLELLNLLAILKEPGTQAAIRECLMERSWGISAAAAALLLTEGDERAIEMVEEVLEDPQPSIRLQAALVLSIWSHEEKAIQILEEGFARSDWESKARILEGLGRIGSSRSIPFLIQTLEAPSQTHRLIAAMALIQCLNH